MIRVKATLRRLIPRPAPLPAAAPLPEPEPQPDHVSGAAPSAPTPPDPAPTPPVADPTPPAPAPAADPPVDPPPPAPWPAELLPRQRSAPYHCGDIDIAALIPQLGAPRLAPADAGDRADPAAGTEAETYANAGAEAEPGADGEGEGWIPAPSPRPARPPTRTGARPAGRAPGPTFDPPPFDLHRPGKRTVAADLGIKPLLTWVDGAGRWGRQANRTPFLEVRAHKVELCKRLGALLRRHGHCGFVDYDGPLPAAAYRLAEAAPLVEAIAGAEARRRAIRGHQVRAAAEFLLGYERVVLEDLRLDGLLNRPPPAGSEGPEGELGRRRLVERMADAGWRELHDLCRAEARLRGVELVLVDPAHTSSECPGCRWRTEDNRGARGAFACRRCGLEMDSGVVGAVNLLRRYYARPGR